MADFSEENIYIQNRKMLDMTGVCDVSSLTPESVEMTLREGAVAVDGNDLKIESFSSETGKIRIIGEISAVTYFERSVLKKGGLFKKHS